MEQHVVHATMSNLLFVQLPLFYCTIQTSNLKYLARPVNRTQKQLVAKDLIHYIYNSFSAPKRFQRQSAPQSYFLVFFVWCSQRKSCPHRLDYNDFPHRPAPSPHYAMPLFTALMKIFKLLRRPPFPDTQFKIEWNHYSL